MTAVERKIVLDENAAHIEHDTRVLDSQCFEDVEEVIVVYINELVPSDAEAICVILFSNAYWVVPALSAGSAPYFDMLLKVTKTHYIDIKQCELTKMPWAWRVKLWGFLPLFPDAGLGSHDLSSLPLWQEVDAMSKEEFIESIQ